MRAERASIPQKLAVTDTVRHLKGASAFAINHMEGSDGRFQWQEGYGTLTIGERWLETVKAYVAQQKEHHRENTASTVYEKINEDSR